MDFRRYCVKAFTLLSFIVILFLVFAPLKKADAGLGRFVGSWLFDKLIGSDLNDASDASATGMTGFLTFLVDPVSTAFTGCTTNSYYDWLNKPDEPTCIPLIPGQGSGLDPTKTQKWQEQNNGYKNGSLFAIAVTSADKAMDTPPPVSLAYFFKEMKEESPIFQEAHAVTLSDSTFSAVATAWKGMRNLAFGVLAIITMVASIMIAIRKKLDAQTVVTAQAVLPRIIISAVLISFSYAFGSLGAQLIVPATKMSMRVLFSDKVAGDPAFFAAPKDACPSLIGGAAINGLTGISNCFLEYSMHGTFGQNILSAIIDLGTVIIFLLSIALYTAVILAAVVVYIVKFLKIILLTIFSPLIFAISALPGQEHRILDWFKDLFAAALALPAMFFILILGGILGLSIGVATSPIPGTDTYLSGSLRGLVGTVVVIAMGITSLKAPGIVEAAIKGPKKK